MSIRLLLIDRAHLPKVATSAFGQLIPGTRPDDHVVIIALGEGGSVLLPGMPMAALQGQVIRWPRWLGPSTGREGDLVLGAVYDLYAALGDDSVPIQLHSYVDWSEFAELHAEVRRFQHISRVPPLPAPSGSPTTVAGLRRGQAAADDLSWVHDDQQWSQWIRGSMGAPAGAAQDGPAAPGPRFVDPAAQAAARYPDQLPARTVMRRVRDGIRARIRRLGEQVRDLYDDIRYWIEDWIDRV